MDRKLGKRLSYLMNHHCLYANDKLKEMGLTYAQANVLMQIKKEPVNQDDLGKKLLLDKARISRLVKQLEATGYIDKKISAKDKRSYHISLSEKGNNRMQDIIMILDESNEKMLAGINDDEIKQLLHLLDRLCLNVSKGGEYHHE